MVNSERDDLIYEEIELLRKAVTTNRNTSKMTFTDFSPEEIKQSLLTIHEINNPVTEMINTTEAVFEFIRRSDMKRSTRLAFLQLEKQFQFFKGLALRDR